MTETKLSFKGFPNEKDSRFEVFIIESSTEEDGYVLYRQLKLLGGNPRYIKVACLNDLAAALVLFRQSNYRFVHISCHGDKAQEKIMIGEEWHTYDKVVSLFPRCFKSRRVSFSACELGNDTLTRELNSRNHWIHSIVAPSVEVDPKISAAYWVAFYTLCFDGCVSVSGNGGPSVHTDKLMEVMEKLDVVFGGDFYIAYSDSKRHRIISRQLSNGQWIDSVSMQYSSFKIDERNGRRIK